MEVRKAKSQEGIILSEIAMRSKAYWGYDDSFIEACREDLTISERYMSLNSVYIIQDKSDIIGFFSFNLNSKSASLDAFFIDPKFIGKGYGRLSWDIILKAAKETGIYEFTIDADPNAEGFYLKMGAVRIGEVESTVFKDRKLPLMKMIVA